MDAGFKEVCTQENWDQRYPARADANLMLVNGGVKWLGLRGGPTGPGPRNPVKADRWHGNSHVTGTRAGGMNDAPSQSCFSKQKHPGNAEDRPDCCIAGRLYVYFYETHGMIVVGRKATD